MLFNKTDENNMDSISENTTAIINALHIEFDKGLQLK